MPTPAERIPRLVQELDDLARRMYWIRQELVSLTASPPVGPTLPDPADAEPRSAEPTRADGTTGPRRADGAAGPKQTEVAGGHRFSGRAGEPAPAGTVDGPMGQDGGRLLAWAGGSITLVGVVMFLVLAASRGWLGPVTRLVAGGLLGLVLVGVAAWTNRRPQGRTGALALAATGFATLYLTIGAATGYYRYLVEPAGLGLGLLTVGAGLALADRWRSQLLAAGTVLGVDVLTAAVADGAWPLTVGLVLAPQLAAAAVVARRDWPVLALVAAVFPVLYGTVAALAGGASDSARVTALLGVFLVGAAVAALVGPNPVAFAAAAVPALAMAVRLGEWRGALLAGFVGVCALGAARYRPVRLAGVLVGAVAFFQATTLALDGAALAGVLLGQALVLTVLAGRTGHALPRYLGAGYGLVGLGLAVFRDAPAHALLVFPAQPYLVRGEPNRSAMATGLALAVLCLLFAVAAGRVDRRWWAAAGAVGLYGAAGTVILLALLVAPTRAGFLAGHAVTTVSWALAALAVLARGVASRAWRVVGLVLMGATAAKLLLFDLLALDGMVRVAAFVGAGLLMLFAGGRYARLVAAAR